MYLARAIFKIFGELIIAILLAFWLATTLQQAFSYFCSIHIQAYFQIMFVFGRYWVTFFTNRIPAFHASLWTFFIARALLKKIVFTDFNRHLKHGCTTYGIIDPMSHIGPLIIGGTTLDCIIWKLVDTHQSATFGHGFNHIRV